MCFCMVGAVRLELTTYRLKADYSNQLSYAPIRLGPSSVLSLSITGSPKKILQQSVVVPCWLRLQ